MSLEDCKKANEDIRSRRVPAQLVYCKGRFEKAQDSEEKAFWQERVKDLELDIWYKPNKCD